MQTVTRFIIGLTLYCYCKHYYQQKRGKRRTPPQIAVYENANPRTSFNKFNWGGRQSNWICLSFNRRKRCGGPRSDLPRPWTKITGKQSLTVTAARLFSHRTLKSALNWKSTQKLLHICRDSYSINKDYYRIETVLNRILDTVWRLCNGENPCAYVGAWVS